MAKRRPITTHPAFMPLFALWFAALFGLAVAVLPTALVEHALMGSGLGIPAPLSSSGRLVAIAAAALVGGATGSVFGWLLARRGLRDPRPTYDEPEFAQEHFIADEPIRRRPLHVREELDAGVSDESVTELPDVSQGDGFEQPEPAPAAHRIAELAGAGHGFMILTPQPIHPPRPAPDLEGLLEQFDAALAAFRSDDDAHPENATGRADPVHAFVARQTGTPAPSPLGGLMPDHQAELRAALDKLARAHRGD